MYWCFYCYEVNRDASGPCVRCGRPVQGPANLSFEDRLIWTLGHPDGDRAILAASTLGVRRVTTALPALRNVVGGSDPFLAVAALLSAIAIAGAEELRGWLLELARGESFMIREVAQESLAELDGCSDPQHGCGCRALDDL